MDNEKITEIAVQWLERHHVPVAVRQRMAVIINNYPLSYFTSDNPEYVLRRAYTEAIRITHELPYDPDLP